VVHEVTLYRIIVVVFLATLLVTVFLVILALFLVILPAKSLLRRRIRSLSIGFIGVVLCFLGFTASWPVPSALTTVVMLGGVLMILGSVSLLGRSVLYKNRTKSANS
jgi:hypothetical protein